MKIAKRYLAIALSFALFLALPLAFTQEAAAASKTKVWQPVQTAKTTVRQDSSNPGVYGFVWSYDKKGLNNMLFDTTGQSRLRTYDKKGYMTSETRLNKDGEPYRQYVYTVNKGKKVYEYDFTVNKGVSKLYQTKVFTYKKGKLSSVTTVSANGESTSVETYRKDGTKEKSLSFSNYSDFYKYSYAAIYDKYGNISNSTTTTTWGDNTTTRTDAYKNTYKKDKLVTTVHAYTNSDGKVFPGSTTNYSYKKDKLVKTVKSEYDTNRDAEIFNTENTVIAYTYKKGGLITGITKAVVNSNSDYSSYNYTETTVINYKKIAVDQKCLKAVNERMAGFTDTSEIGSVLPSNDAK